MIGENHGAAVAERGCDALAPVGGEDLHLFVVEEGMVVEEAGRFLVDGFDHPALGRERRAPLGVGMRGGADVGTGLVDGVMDAVRAVVDRRRLALLVGGSAVRSHEHEVADSGPLEGHAVSQQPHVIRPHRVAAGDVAIAQLAPPQYPEQAIGAGQVDEQAGAFGMRIGLERLGDIRGVFRWDVGSFHVANSVMPAVRQSTSVIGCGLASTH